MASGFAKYSKANSTKSLGSFVDIASAASSEFETLDFEDIELAPPSRMAAGNDQDIIGKNRTPAPASLTPSQADPDREDHGEMASGPGAHDPADPLQEGLQNLEQATQKAAEAAKDFTSKLWVTGTAEAKSSVMRLAGDVSSWWAALDPGATSSTDKPQDSNRSAQGNEEVQMLFDLPAEEELMEKFSCTLVQTLNCTHNSFSKPRKMGVAGKLYITDKHTCFEAEDNKFAIPHSDIKKVSKSPSSAGTLHLELSKAGEYVAWERFRGLDLESALGLLEHLTA